MEHWEFLLQKEGDHSWLPLESPNVEILEGRYQVLARSSLINTRINVQVSHFFNRHGVHEEQLQVRSQKTNFEGVVVVIPFTYFQPGRWQLACTLSETDQQTWYKFMQLQVLHQESDVPEDWESLNWQQHFGESINHPDVTKQEVASVADVTKQEVASVAADLKQADNQVAASLNSPVAQSASSATSRPKAKAASLRLPNFTNQAQPSKFEVSAGHVFPPQISQSHPSDVVRKSPELPVVPRPKVSSVDVEMVRSYLNKATLQKLTPILDHQPLLVETAFEALNLQERFRSRLNTFAKKTETGASSKSDVTPQDLAGSQQDTGTSQTNLLVNLDQPQDSESQISATGPDRVDSFEPHQKGEVLPVRAAEQLTPQSSIAQPPISTDPVGSDQIVPVPDLVLPEEELVMGQLITVRVTLPDPSTPLYVKLWIKDRQTRSLLDGPRWLVEFVSNEGVLEASTQLMVPLGSLEVSFEAIAINMQTKSESYKATVNRPVMPLGLFMVEDSDA